MPPNLFSRLVQSGDNRSSYDRLRDEHDDDIESRAGLALDEENLAHHFRDDELEHADDLGLADSRVSPPHSPVAGPSESRHGAVRTNRRDARPRWLMPEEDGDNDVPPSLLVEGPDPSTTRPNTHRAGPQQARNAGRQTSNRRIQAQWETAQAHQRLHQEEEYGPSTGQRQAGGNTRRAGFTGSPKDKAMFRWANVSNLDVFIRDVYDYYLGAGMWCILLERFLHLL